MEDIMADKLFLSRPQHLTHGKHRYWYTNLLQSGRYGRLTGIKYWDGERVSTKVEHIRSCLKRGVWQYTLNDAQFTPQDVQLDNGVSVDLGSLQAKITEKNEFLKERKAAMEYKSTAE
jgi:hypothetical protein